MNGELAAECHDLCSLRVRFGGERRERLLFGVGEVSAGAHAERVVENDEEETIVGACGSSAHKRIGERQHEKQNAAEAESEEKQVAETAMACVASQTESENCLVLNVLTPGRRGRLRVMVYIHGGGFTSGSGVLTAFSDRFVREEQVVLVGINHRLGVLGYAYLGAISSKYADSGNAGQLDLIAALQWVCDNIANFGGDPKNVTIFGESGGGAKISTLLAMPAAEGLFKRAIVESGSMLRVVDLESAAKLGKDLLDTCGLSAAQVDELQNLPLDRIMAASPGSGSGAMIRLGPVVDGRSIPQQTGNRRRPMFPPT